MGNGGNLNAIYAGRFVAGLGVGQTVVVGPVYIAEIVSSMMIRNARARTNWSRPRLSFVDYALSFSLASYTWESS